MRSAAAATTIVAIALAAGAHGATRASQPTLAYTSDRLGTLDVWILTADGARPLTKGHGDDSDPAWSPDGERIVFSSNASGSFRLYVVPARGGRAQAISSPGKGADAYAVWSPDGTQIAFQSSRTGNWEVWVASADGTELRNLSRSGADDEHPSWSPDGTQIVWTRTVKNVPSLVVSDAQRGSPRAFPTPGLPLDPTWGAGGLIAYTALVRRNYDIYVADVDHGQSRRLTTSPAEDSDPAWSPDGSELAFTSARDGNYEIYVTDLEGRTQRNVTRSPRSNELRPTWGPAGWNVKLLRRPASAALTGFACTTPAPGSTTHNILGTSAADTLCGTATGDTISAGGGNDTIVGDGGADSLLGQGGTSDKVYARDSTRDTTVSGGTGTGDSCRRDAGEPGSGCEKPL